MNAGAMVAIMAANTAAAAAAAAQQRQLDAFRLAGATAPERAQRPEAMGLPRDDTFVRLAHEGVLRDAGDGRVWLDEAALIARRSAGTRMSRRAKFVVIGVLLALLLLAVGALLMARGSGVPPGSELS